MVKCNSCGGLIDEPENTELELRDPCPSCGSKARLYTIELQGEITFREKLKIKARHGGVGEVKPFLELQTGDDFYRKTGEWSRREKMEDRENDRYLEHIVNPKTGEAIHHCEEPLSQHQGHGSAKRNGLRARSPQHTVTKERVEFRRGNGVRQRYSDNRILSGYAQIKLYRKIMLTLLIKLKSILQALRPRFSKFSWWVIGIVVGAIITHRVDNFLDQAKDDSELARYYVASMPPHCKPSSSLEFDDQIKRFVEATRRARAAGDGIPVWRNDCSIGAHFSVNLDDEIRLHDNLKAN